MCRAGRLLLLLLLCSAMRLVALQAISLPYTPQVPERCQNPKLEHYVEAINKCCSLCPPAFPVPVKELFGQKDVEIDPRREKEAKTGLPVDGYRVLHSCNKTVDTHCVPCEEGMYTSVWSRAERCLGCIPPCRTGLVEVNACSPTQARRCWCPAHHFCSQKRSDEMCLRCVAFQACAPGYGVVRSGTGKSNQECAPCGPGTFSDVESHTAECKPHTPCKSVLLAGNSTSDNICQEPIGGATLSPHKTGSGSPPSQRSFTKAPTLDVKNDLSADISSIAGWAAGAMFAMFALISGTLLCFAFRNKGQPCASLCGTEKQPFPATEKLPGIRPQDDNSLCPEDQNLLETSASSSSGSLHRLQASEKSSGVSDMSTPKIEPDGLQQRAPLLDNCVSHSTADSKQSSSGRTHVNVSCVVNLCSSDHSAPIRSLSGLVPAVPGDGCSTEGDLPLSKEESPVKREPGGQIAVEVEDNMDIFYLQEKLLPLSL